VNAGPVQAPASALRPLLLPAGREYHVDMNRRWRQYFNRDFSDRSGRADLLLREQPNEEEDDEDEDEGNGTGDEGDEEEDNGGYSVQV
jgi:hypothetical protein